MLKDYIKKRAAEINDYSNFNPDYPNTIVINNFGRAYLVTLAELRRGKIISEKYIQKLGFKTDQIKYFSNFSNEMGVARGDFPKKFKGLPRKIQEIFGANANLLGQKNEFFKGFKIVYLIKKN